MRASPTDARALQRHVSATYFTLRMGMGALAAALPPLLWLGGRLGDGESLRCSMSAYYHSPTMRDPFVGALVAIGVFLYLYKGFSRRENWALNAAGVFAVGIALVPTGPTCEAPAPWVTLHGTLAVAFFVAIAYVSVFRAADTLSLVRDTVRAGRLRAGYRALGALMLVSPLVAAALSAVLQPRREGHSLVFFVETVAVLTFAAYWLVKSRELSETGAEELALERKLQPVASPPPVAERCPGRLVQIEPGRDDHQAQARPPGA